MNHNERENLKKKIEADLELLVEESWMIEVRDNLRKVLNDLQAVSLEGYDD